MMLIKKEKIHFIIALVVFIALNILSQKITNSNKAKLIQEQKVQNSVVLIKKEEANNKYSLFSINDPLKKSLK